MELKEICKEFNARYDEIFQRISNNFAKFKYATHSEDDLERWEVFDDDCIVVVTSTYCMGETDYSHQYIDCDYLETDEEFEKWLDYKCNQRRLEDEGEAKTVAQYKEQKERKLLEELKKKYE